MHNTSTVMPSDRVRTARRMTEISPSANASMSPGSGPMAHPRQPSWLAQELGCVGAAPQSGGVMLSLVRMVGAGGAARRDGRGGKAEPFEGEGVDGDDGDAEVGLGEGGGVVDAVADHGDLAAGGLQLGDLGGLVAG